MIVICTDNTHFVSKLKTRLTLNNKYKVENIYDIGYRVLNDEGELETFDKSRFIELKKVRRKRIDRLLGI